MTAQVMRLSASVRIGSSVVHRHRAEVVVLAERRERRDSAPASVTMDPIEAARRWWDFWAGVRK